jgi:hypothetical protein
MGAFGNHIFFKNIKEAAGIGCENLCRQNFINIKVKGSLGNTTPQ